MVISLMVLHYLVMDCLMYVCIAGNKKSLCDAVDKGVNLREQILDTFKEYYHGGLMKLAVIGGGKIPNRVWIILQFVQR